MPLIMYTGWIVIANKVRPSMAMAASVPESILFVHGFHRSPLSPHRSNGDAKGGRPTG